MIKGLLNILSTNPKDLIGIKKPPLGLIPPVALIHESLAMKNGAAKYGPYNWRSNPVQCTIYIDACLRHLLAYQDGEDYASDSSVHHLGHARACLGIILDALATGNLIDNRPVAGKFSETVTSYTEADGPTHPIKGYIGDPITPVTRTHDPVTGATTYYIPNMVWPYDNSTKTWSTSTTVGKPVLGDVK